MLAWLEVTQFFSEFPSIRHELFAMVVMFLGTSSISRIVEACGNGVGVTMLLTAFKMKPNQDDR
jgi:hypothetical protein